MFRGLLLVLLAVALTQSQAHQHSPSDPIQHQFTFAQDSLTGGQKPFTGPTWAEKYGSQYDSTFSGPLSFSHLPYARCLETNDNFDIAVLGFPFDTGVTYRPG